MSYPKWDGIKHARPPIRAWNGNLSIFCDRQSDSLAFPAFRRDGCRFLRWSLFKAESFTCVFGGFDFVGFSVENRPGRKFSTACTFDVLSIRFGSFLYFFRSFCKFPRVDLCAGAGISYYIYKFDEWISDCLLLIRLFLYSFAQSEKYYATLRKNLAKS